MLESSGGEGFSLPQGYSHQGSPCRWKTKTVYKMPLGIHLLPGACSPTSSSNWESILEVLGFTSVLVKLVGRHPGSFRVHQFHQTRGRYPERCFCGRTKHAGAVPATTELVHAALQSLSHLQKRHDAVLSVCLGPHPGLGALRLLLYWGASGRQGTELGLP